VTILTVTGVLAAFLVLAFIALFWVIKHYKTSVVRSYQQDELGIKDPIGCELKKLAKELAKIQEDADSNGGFNKAHVDQNVKIKREIIRLGQELRNNCAQNEEFTPSSCEQRT